MWEDFVESGLRDRFLKRVLLPGGGAALCWWVGEQLPRPTNWDLLCYLLAILLTLLTVVNFVLWLAKSIVVLFVEKPESKPPTPRPKVLKPKIPPRRPELSPEAREKALADLQVRVDDFHARRKVTGTYRHVDAALWRNGKPPSIAVCEAESVELELKWKGNNLTILRDGKSFTITSSGGDGHPASTPAEFKGKGTSFQASGLAGMTLGMKRLKLEVIDGKLECRFTTTMSAGHGTAELWVSLVLDLETNSGTYETFSEYDSCR